MFSFVEELFKNASKGIRSALDDLSSDKDLLEDIKSDSGEYTNEVNDICANLESITTDIDALEKNVQIAEVNMGIVNDSEISLDLENLETQTLNISDLSFQQSLEDQITFFDSFTPEEFFQLLEQLNLSDEEKLLARDAYQKGNFRAAYTYILVSRSNDRTDEIDAEIKRLEEEREQYSIYKNPNKDHPEWSTYVMYFTGTTRISTPEQQQEFDRLKTIFDPKSLEVDALKREKQSIESLQSEYRIAIRQWNFDYLDNIDNLETKYSPTEDMALLFNDCVERFKYDSKYGVDFSQTQFLESCESLGINPESVNMLLFWNMMKNSSEFSGYFSDGKITEEDMKEKWLLTTELNNKNSLEARAMIYLTNEQIEKYNYLYNVEGKDRAYEYLLAFEPTINNLQGIKIAEETIKNIGSGKSSESRILKAFSEGGWSGVTKYLNDVGTFFNRNTNMTSQEYADIYIAQMLMISMNSKEITDEELKNYLDSQQIDDETYKKLLIKSEPVTQADILYEQGLISKQEYQGWKELLQNEDYLNFIEVTKDSTVFGISENSVLSMSYNIGNTVGYMAPTIALSYLGAGTSLGSILAKMSLFTSSYGGSYKGAKNSGATELEANLFALLSSGSQVTLEYALGGITGLAKGKPGVISSSIDDVARITNFRQALSSNLISLGKSAAKEIPEELLENVIDIGLSAFILGESYDISNFPEETKQTIIQTFISSLILEAPTSAINTGFQTYNAYSFKIGENQHINYTQEQLSDFINDEGNVDQDALRKDLEKRIENDIFETSEDEIVDILGSKFVNPIEEITDPVIDLEPNSNTPNISGMIDGVMDKLQDAKLKAEGVIDSIQTKILEQTSNNLEVNSEEILAPETLEEIDEVLPVDPITERLNNIEILSEIEGLDDYNSGIEVNYEPVEEFMSSNLKNETNEASTQSNKLANLWESNYSSLYVFLNNIEDVIEAIKNGELELSNIKDSFKPGDEVQNILEERYLEKGKGFNYTDSSHCVALSSNPLLPSVINPNFFAKHKDRLIEAYRDMVLTTNYVGIEIPNVVFTNELFEKLLVIPGKRYTFIDVNLTNEQIQKLKSNFIGAKLIKDGERIEISSEYAFDFYTPEQLKSMNELSIKLKDLDNENFENLTFLPTDATIKFDNPNKSSRMAYICTFSEEEILFTIKEKLDILDKLGKHFTIVLPIEKRSAFNNVFANTKYENLQIKIENDFYQYSLNEYLKEEEFLYSLVEPINNANLSPLERYLAVYNIVKNFKPYKENEGDKAQSRRLRYILNNDYMVCVGYANLLAELMDKVGLDGSEISIGVDTSYDGGFTLEEKEVINSGHARTVVAIDDNKYNIHGLYIADPTWDNSREDNFLNHALMPYDKMQTQYRMFWYNSFDVILDVHNFQEFNDQVNFLLKREIKQQQQNKYSNHTFNDVLMNSYRDVCLKIVNSIYSDSKYLNYIKLLNNCKTENDYVEFLTDIGNYLLTRINQPISPNTILDASMESMRKTRGYLGDLKLQKIDDTTRKEYFFWEERMFPYEISSENEFKLNKKSDSVELNRNSKTDLDSVNQNQEDSLSANDILNVESIINSVKTSILPMLDTNVKNLLEISNQSNKINDINLQHINLEISQIFDLLNKLKTPFEYRPQLQMKLNQLLGYVESLRGSIILGDEEIIGLQQQFDTKLDELYHEIETNFSKPNEDSGKYSIRNLENIRYNIGEEQRKIQNSLADFRDIISNLKREKFGIKKVVDYLEWVYSSIYGLRHSTILEYNLIDNYQYNGLVNQMRNLLDILNDIKRDSYIHDYYYNDSKMVDAVAKHSVFEIARKILGNFEELEDATRRGVRNELVKIDDQIQELKNKEKNNQELYYEKRRILRDLFDIKNNLANFNNDINIFLKIRDVSYSMLQKINKIEEQINIIRQKDLNLESIKLNSELIEALKSELETSRGNVLDAQKVKDLYDKLVHNLGEITKELNLKHESTLSISNNYDNFMLEFLDELDSSGEQIVESEESNDNDVTPLEDISNQIDEINIQTTSFIPVNVKEYVQTGLENGNLIPKEASKFARIFARQGEVGEQVVTYSANGIVETTNDVSIDETTGEPGWIVTKALNGEVVVDEFGNKNEWIIPDSTFKKKYEIDPENSKLFKPKGEPQMFVQIPDNIKFNAPWGEEMNISRGGYLNITNLDDIYGIQERDFNDTYRFTEPEVLSLNNNQSKQIFAPKYKNIKDDKEPVLERINDIKEETELEGIGFQKLSSIDVNQYYINQNLSNKYIRYKILDYEFIVGIIDDFKKYLQQKFKNMTQDEIDKFIFKINNSTLDVLLTPDEFKKLSDFIFYSVGEDINIYNELIFKNFKKIIFKK